MLKCAISVLKFYQMMLDMTRFSFILKRIPFNLFNCSKLSPQTFFYTRFLLLCHVFADVIAGRRSSSFIEEGSGGGFGNTILFRLCRRSRERSWCRSSRKFGLSPGKWQANNGNGGAWLHSLAPSCLPLILVLSHGNLPLQARGKPSGGLKDKPPIAL